MHLCAVCVEQVLQNVCPTCGGGFAPRPIRPRVAYRDAPQLGLAHQPASITRKHSRWTADDLAQMTTRLKDVPPQDR
nr:DUF1272 domain-containing protein [Yoonia maricola]